MHLADFVQKQRSRVRQVELSQLLTIGSGKCSRLVAEQFALQQLIWNGGAVDFDEGLIFATRLRVNHSRYNFFSCATLASDQHGSRGIGHLLDDVLHFFHARAGSEQAREITIATYLIAELR